MQRLSPTRLSLALLGVLAACSARSAPGASDASRAGTDASTMATVAPPALAFALDGLPRAARVVIVADVPSLLASPVGARASEFLAEKLTEDPLVATLRQLCPVHARDFGLVAIGADGHGEGMSARVRSGLSEAAVVDCMGAILRSKGADVVHETVAGTVAYHANERASASDNVWLAVPRPGELVAAGNRDWLLATVDTAAPRASTNASLVAAAAHVDASAPLWIVAVLEDDDRAGFVRASEGKLEHAPISLAVSLQASEALALTVSCSFETAAQAAQGAEVARALLAQAKATLAGSPYASLVDGVVITTEGTLVVVRLSLDAKGLDVLGRVMAETVQVEHPTTP